MQPNVSFSLFAHSAQQQPECPPAGASQEVNEAAPSLAAPSASGQQAGTPPRFDGVFVPSRRTDGEHLHGGWYGDWGADWQASGCSLDAPVFIPVGSHSAFELGIRCKYVLADGYGSRP